MELFWLHPIYVGIIPASILLYPFNLCSNGTSGGLGFALILAWFLGFIIEASVFVGFIWLWWGC